MNQNNKRIFGDVQIDTNYEVNVPRPLDARSLVIDEEHLTSSSWWNSSISGKESKPIFYDGMPVISASTGNIYVWQGGVRRIEEETEILKEDWRQVNVTEEYLAYPITMDTSDRISLGVPVDVSQWSIYGSGSNDTRIKGFYLTNDALQSNGGMMMENNAIILGNYKGQDSSFVITNINGKVTQGIYIPTANYEYMPDDILGGGDAALRTLLIANKNKIVMRSGLYNDASAKFTLDTSNTTLNAKNATLDIDTSTIKASANSIGLYVPAGNRIEIGQIRSLPIDVSSEVDISAGILNLDLDTNHFIHIDASNGVNASIGNYKEVNTHDHQYYVNGEFVINRKHLQTEGSEPTEELNKAQMKFYNQKGDIQVTAEDGSLNIYTRRNATFDVSQSFLMNIDGSTKIRNKGNYIFENQGDTTFENVKNVDISVGGNLSFNTYSPSEETVAYNSIRFNRHFDAETGNETAAGLGIVRRDRYKYDDISLNASPSTNIQMYGQDGRIKIDTEGMYQMNVGTYMTTTVTNSIKFITTSDRTDYSSMDFFTNGGHITLAPGCKDGADIYNFNETDGNSLNLASNKIYLWHNEANGNDASNIGRVLFTKPVKDVPGQLYWDGTKLQWVTAETTLDVSRKGYQDNGEPPSSELTNSCYIKIADIYLPMRTAESNNENIISLRKTPDYYANDTFQGNALQFRNCVFTVASRLHTGIYMVDVNTAYHMAANTYKGEHRHSQMIIHEFGRQIQTYANDIQVDPVQVVGVISYECVSNTHISQRKPCPYGIALASEPSSYNVTFAKFTIYLKTFDSNVTWNFISKTDQKISDSSVKNTGIDVGVWNLYTSKDDLVDKDAADIINQISTNYEDSYDNDASYHGAYYFKGFAIDSSMGEITEITAKPENATEASPKFLGYNGENYIWSGVSIDSSSISLSNTSDGIAFLLGRDGCPGQEDVDPIINTTYSSRYVYFDYYGNLNARAFYASSDIRNKTDIASIPYVEDEKLPAPVQFAWKDTSKYTYGFIAQELETRYPELVNTDDEGFKRVDYNATFSMIIGKLMKRIEILENEVESLKK